MQKLRVLRRPKVASRWISWRRTRSGRASLSSTTTQSSTSTTKLVRAPPQTPRAPPRHLPPYRPRPRLRARARVRACSTAARGRHVEKRAAAGGLETRMEQQQFATASRCSHAGCRRSRRARGGQRWRSRSARCRATRPPITSLELTWTQWR